MKLAKIIPVLLVVTLLSQCVFVNAEIDIPSMLEDELSDMVGMDKVFKYDYIELNKSDENIAVEDTKEAFKFHNAVNVVTALDIMGYKDDGTFSEDEAVPYKEFASVILGLAMGDMPEIESQYANYPDNRYTTQDEAAHYIVGILGYDIYTEKNGGTVSRAQIAIKNGLFDDIDYNGEKNITRGEFAQLIYNALNSPMVEQTTFGETERYSKDEDNTLIMSKFDSEIVSGIVTSQFGISLYPNDYPEENTISIDRTPYMLGDYVVDEMLGHRALAVIKHERNDKRTILMVTKDQYDDTLAVPLDDTAYAAEGVFYYEVDGKERKINYSNIDRIIENSNQVTPAEFLDIVNSSDGEVRFASVNSSKYDLAIVMSPSTYVVSNVSPMNELINFEYNAKYGEDNFIKVGSDDESSLWKNGSKIRLSDIKPGNVVEIIANSDSSSFYVNVIENSVSGAVETVEDDKLYIDGKKYYISKAYDEARKTDASLPVLKLGTEGTFYVNNMGGIVGYAKVGLGDYKYGILKELGSMGSGLSAQKLIRIFNDDAQWVNYPLATTLTLDGETGLSDESALSVLQSSKDIICYKPVRFKANSRNEITFLDTVTFNHKESGDDDTIMYKDRWKDYMHWTCDTKGMPTFLQRSKYYIRNDALYFKIPKDVTKEEEYVATYENPYKFQQYCTLDLYNVDDYLMATIVVDAGSQMDMKDFTSNFSRMVVMRISEVLDDDGETALAITGFDGTGSLYAKAQFMVTKEEMVDFAKTLSAGDIVHFHSVGGEIEHMELIAAAEDWDKDHWKPANTSTGGADEAIGTITEVKEIAGYGYVKATLNGGEEVWGVNSAAYYSKSFNSGEQMDIGDIQPGDRVFAYADRAWMRVLVLKP